MVCIYVFLHSPQNRLNTWQKIKARGYLTWVTRPSPLTYYESLDGVIGLEFDILSQFCSHYDLELKVILSQSNSDLFALLSSNQVDVAGANLTATVHRLSLFLSSIAYDHTSIKLVSSFGQEKIKSLAFLSNLTGHVLANSSYVTIAEDLINEHNAIIKFIVDKSLYELLQRVFDGEIDYTLIDSNLLSVYQSYMPKLRSGIQLSKINDLVFLLPDINDFSVKVDLDSFIKNYISQGNVDKYKLVIKESLPRSKPADTVQFLRNYSKRWKGLKTQIYAVAEEYELSPILLGAISYQESHWNKNAVSPTLVKGIMMLTKAVAKEQGVTNRLDTLQSLEGGARHFIKTLKKIPKRIIESDRIKFALASYNIGFGNLEKARIMAQMAEKNPDSWDDVKEFLIMFNGIDSINADGETAVKYVENIEVYKNLLQWKEQQ